ncbi:TPA: DUF551 domain-containing protein [Serratia marcescens]
MTQTLTTETIKQWRSDAENIARRSCEYETEYSAAEAILALTAELLANREAQPVGFYTTVSGRKGVVWHNGAPEDDTAIYTAPPAPAVPDGYCVMPLTLTAANGAKGALSGEFKVSRTVRCHECGGEGCDDCADAGEFEEEITVPWDTIKDIYRAAVDACRAAMLAQPVSGGYKLPDGWIACSERMPELDKRVLLYFGSYGGHIEDGCIGDDGDGPYHYFFDGDSLQQEPTHWMPLPAAPEGGNG